MFFDVNFFIRPGDLVPTAFKGQIYQKNGLAQVVETLRPFDPQWTKKPAGE